MPGYIITNRASFESYCCIIKDRFYFAIGNEIPLSSSNIHIFSIDNVLTYEKFYDDFGPFNLAQVYRYCQKVNNKLKALAFSNSRIVHHTSENVMMRTNAAFLVGCYQIIYLNRCANEAYKYLCEGKCHTFAAYRDASSGPSYYDLDLQDCLRAVQKALTMGILNFDTFDLEDYEYNEKVENGDLSWIVPKKLIAFSGPHSRTMIDNGYPMHAPEFFLPYFHKNNVTNVVRLNQKIYESARFVRAGITHHDLFFPDGSVPSRALTLQFLNICETAPGAIAVHCKAGLGRTGTLIGCYLMKHFRFTAPEAIAWTRICRPGSIIGQQQSWLEEQQAWCWEEGRRRRREKSLSSLPTSQPTDLTYENGQVNHASRSIDRMALNVNKDPSKPPAQPREDSIKRKKDWLETGRCPSQITSLTNNEKRVDRPQVYHHKIWIAGTGQRNDSRELIHPLTTSRDFKGLQVELGMVPSSSMHLPQKSGAYKPESTQGDRLNQIKVNRKRNKLLKANDGITVRSITPQLTSCYSRVDFKDDTGVGVREIDRLHDGIVDDELKVKSRLHRERNLPSMSSVLFRNAPSTKMTTTVSTSWSGSNAISGNRSFAFPSRGAIDFQLSGRMTSDLRDGLSNSYPRARGMPRRSYEIQPEMGSSDCCVITRESSSRPCITPPPTSASLLPYQSWRRPVPERGPSQELPVIRDTQTLFRASQPINYVGISSFYTSDPTRAAVVSAASATRKHVDFSSSRSASQSSLFSTPLSTNSLPILRTVRSFSKNAHQGLCHSTYNDNSASRNTTDTIAADQQDYYQRPYGNLRIFDNKELPNSNMYGCTVDGTLNGRNCRSRGTSPIRSIDTTSAAQVRRPHSIECQLPLSPGQGLQ